MIQPPDYFDGRRQTSRDIRAFFRKYIDNLKNRLFISSVYFISYRYLCISNQVIYWKYEFLKMAIFFIAFFAMLVLMFLIEFAENMRVHNIFTSTKDFKILLKFAGIRDKTVISVIYFETDYNKCTVRNHNEHKPKSFKCFLQTMLKNKFCQQNSPKTLP